MRVFPEIWIGLFLEDVLEKETGRKPFTRQFLMAFFFEDEDLSRKLIECFEIIWDTAEPVKMGLLKKGEPKDDNFQK